MYRRLLVVAALALAIPGCAHTHGELRAVADHDLSGPRAGVSIAAQW